MLRRVNLLALCAAPLAIVLLAIVLLVTDVTNPLVAYGALSLGVVALVLAFVQKWRYLRNSSSEDAARHIDEVVDGKERFLTLTTVDRNSPASSELSLDAVRDQAQTLAADYKLESALPFELEPQAKRSALISPLVLLMLFLVVWLGPTSELQSRVMLDREATARAEKLRELIEDVPALPSDVREELYTLADTLEEEGLLNDDLIDRLEKAIDEIEELEERGALGPDAENYSLQNEQPKEEPEEQQQQPEEQKEKEEQEKQEPNQAKQQQGESSGESESDKNGERSPADSPNSEVEEKGGQGGESKQSQKPSESGEKGEGEKKGSGEEQSGEEGDDKKSTVGVGDGKGGEEGEGKKQGKGGKPQAGADDSGAKDGKAENQQQGKGEEEAPSPSGDESGESEGERAKKKGESSKDGQKKSTQGEGAAPEQGGKKSENQSADNLKSELQEIKERAKQEQSQAQGEKGEQPQEQGEQGEKSDRPGKQQSGNKSANSEQGEQEDKMLSDKSEKSGAPKPKEGSEKSDTPPKDPNATPSSKNNSKAEQDIATEGKKDAGRPKTIVPSQTAKRFGPFEGGEDEDLLSGVKEKTDVAIPVEEKILVRQLGREDPRYYKHKGGAAAKTKLGEAEFKKPEAATAGQAQPIPVEYRDLLR